MNYFYDVSADEMPCCFGVSIIVNLACTSVSVSFTHTHMLNFILYTSTYPHTHTQNSPNQLLKFGEGEPHKIVPIATVSLCNSL